MPPSRSVERVRHNGIQYPAARTRVAGRQASPANLHRIRCPRTPYPMRSLPPSRGALTLILSEVVAGCNEQRLPNRCGASSQAVIPRGRVDLLFACSSTLNTATRLSPPTLLDPLSHHGHVSVYLAPMLMKHLSPLYRL